ncbi:co-chaperone YbbN [Thalassotalea fusca]
MANNTIALTLENFQQVVLEESKSKLVFVDFWADQVPESVELRDKLAVALAPFESEFVLATVDCQSQQQIAMQFGIQGLPTAVVVKDGQPIDAVSGPQTDESIKSFLEKYLPKPEDGLLNQAQELLANGQINEAYAAITQAHQIDEQRADIAMVLIDINIQLGKIDDAKALLATIKMVDQDSQYEALVAKLALAEQAADSPEIQQLEEQLAASPDDVVLKQKLAAQYHQVNRNEEALSMLFSLVTSNDPDGTSKQQLLDVLKALPDSDPLVKQYRRKLYTLMY